MSTTVTCDDNGPRCVYSAPGPDPAGWALLTLERQDELSVLMHICPHCRKDPGDRLVGEVRRLCQS